ERACRHGETRRARTRLPRSPAGLAIHRRCTPPTASTRRAGPRAGRASTTAVHATTALACAASDSCPSGVRNVLARARLSPRAQNAYFGSPPRRRDPRLDDRRAASPMPEIPGSRESGARTAWIMLLALTGGFALSQAYRTVAAIMAPQLQAEFGLDPQALGLFAATFQ